jgi:hypothetical protein
MQAPNPATVHGCIIYLLGFGVALPIAIVYLAACIIGSGCPD